MIQAGVIGLTGVWLRQQTRPAISSERSSGGKVIVIGAGFAGLAAARRLAETDFDVTVLEARDRLGGRVWTDESTGTPLDLGASWIHGHRKNPITLLANQFGLKTQENDDEQTFFTLGNQIEDASDFEKRFAPLLASAIKLSERTNSVEDAIRRSNVEKTLSEKERNSFRRWLNSSIEHEYAADLAELSGYFYDEGGEFKGGDFLLPGGLGAISNRLAEGLAIEQGTVVREIDWSTSEVIVRTNRGDHRASKVILTLPLGVLQSGTISFLPALPAAKLGAINRLGMGLMNKTCLAFPKASWPAGFNWLNPESQIPGRWAEFYDPQLKSPHLIGFHVGSQARQVEQLSDTATVEEAVAAIRQFAPRIHAPTASLITRWSQDPFALGSYSFIKKGAMRNDREELQKPLANRLWFSGEATHSRYPATMHGAYLSGIAVTKAILES